MVNSMRRAGILLPISSLPSKYGIGAFSKEAYEFVDRLKQAGQSYWQILPLGPTGYGDSPYQSFSTFAGSAYYIDLEQLIQAGWLTKEECENSDYGNDVTSVDYDKLFESRPVLLKKAFMRSNIEKNCEYEKFCSENAYWLDDYALYMALKKKLFQKSFMEWPEDIRIRKPEALKKWEIECSQDIAFYKFQQYLFITQWMKLKKYANKNGIRIIGDIPIYVAFDSADTWSNPKLFQLDEEGFPTGVAGCPPDCFSITGQLWGNPLYDWKYHKETGYDWWMKRIAYCCHLYDVVRIDHFRGFDEYYAIPYGDKTAEFGCWEKGPGYDLFKVMKEKLGKKEVIAEDLGFLTKSVIHLVKKTGYPGMKILQFAFDSREESDYLPHNYIKNCVVYTGTHDNDTTVGWAKTMNKKDRSFAMKYLGVKNSKDLPFAVVKAALSSVADTAIIPMQDYLELGSEARMNTPSTLGGNWKWRMKNNDFSEEKSLQIAEYIKLYGRLHHKR